MLPELMSSERAREEVEVTRALVSTFPVQHQRLPISRWQIIRIVRLMRYALGDDRDVRIQVLRRFFPYGKDGLYVQSTKDLNWVQALVLVLRLLEIGRFDPIPAGDPSDRVCVWLKYLADDEADPNASQAA